MRQVEQKRQAQAIAIADPIGSGAIVRRAPSALKVQTKKLWVLHKQLAVRLLALFLVVAIGAVGLANRHAISNYVADLSERGSALFAQAGLSVAQISLSGYALSSEEDLFQAIGLEPHQSIMDFDADAARDRLLAMPSVTSASIRKIYPNQLIVELDEKKPLAIWTVDGVNFAIDSEGNRIASVVAPISGLPLFVGDGASDDIPHMLKLLESNPTIGDGLIASSRIGDRRWDLIYDNGVRIMLPEAGVAAAMQQATTLIERHNIFARDIAAIDLRVSDYVAIRPVVREQAAEEDSQ